MTSLPKQNSLVAISSLLLTLAAHALQPPIPGSASTLTLQMNGYTTVEGTIAKDENGKPTTPKVPAYANEWAKQDSNGNVVEEGTEEVSNTQKVKISNKELLEMLVSEGVISDISGWSLKLVSPAVSSDDDSGGEGPYFYIEKKGGNPIYVGDYFETWDYSKARSIKHQTVAKYKFDKLGNQTGSSYKESGTITSTTAVYTTFSTENGQVRDEALLQINGIWQESGSLMNFGTNDSPDYRYIAKSIKLASISGDLTTYDKQTDTHSSSVIDGSWYARATVLQDISAIYPEAAASAIP